MGDRSHAVSSYTIIKGSLIAETYAVFQGWDYGLSKAENLKRVRELNTLGAATANWAESVVRVLNRRFDPAGPDRPLVDLAKAGCRRDVWGPLLLFHMTRDEYLVRDFLTHWLYPQFVAGAYRLRSQDVIPYLHTLSEKKHVAWSGRWTASTRQRVASGLLRIAVDFGLLRGAQHREFTPYHLPEEAFLYLLHLLMEREANPRRVIDAEDWHLYLMNADAVEQELLRLHQFRKLHYEVAGTLAQIQLPCATAADYARGLH